MSEQETQVQESAAAEQAAFDSMFAQSAEKQAEERVSELETPPEAEETPDPLAELRGQAGRIPELEKQLQDVNGRYGRLTQKLTEIQQRMATSATSGAAAKASADADALLKEIEGEFEDYPEFQAKLKTAFSKVINAGKVPADTADIDRRVMERLNAERQAERERNMREAQTALSEAHPDWMTVRETSEYKSWLETLAPRVKKRFLNSMDPDHVADKLDEFKDWREKQGKEKAPSATRLQAATTPRGTGTPPPRGEITEQAAFDAVFKNRNKR